jgi:hypothetical protein
VCLCISLSTCQHRGADSPPGPPPFSAVHGRLARLSLAHSHNEAARTALRLPTLEGVVYPSLLEGCLSSSTCTCTCTAVSPSDSSAHWLPRPADCYCQCQIRRDLIQCMSFSSVCLGLLGHGVEFMLQMCRWAKLTTYNLSQRQQQLATRDTSPPCV